MIKPKPKVTVTKVKKKSHSNESLPKFEINSVGDTTLNLSLSKSTKRSPSPNRVMKKNVGAIKRKKSTDSRSKSKKV